MSQKNEMVEYLQEQLEPGRFYSNKDLLATLSVSNEELKNLVKESNHEARSIPLRYIHFKGVGLITYSYLYRGSSTDAMKIGCVRPPPFKKDEAK